METLCHHCDLFVGYSASGICISPADQTPEWLADHCWICHRSRDEIQAENDAREFSTPIGLGGRRVPAEPGVDMSRPGDHGIVRRLP